MQSSKTLIPLHYFYDETILSEERARLFSSQWFFVGFTDDLQEPNQFITVDYLGKSVVIKNFDGELKAFLNVCSHRFSKICLKKTGQGPLQCPYHGWTYDKDGLPYAIPRKAQFEDLNPAELKLKSFKIASLGRFLFLHENIAVPSIQEFLGTAYPFLEKVSHAMGQRIDTNTLTIKANWKVVVENTLEEYHVRQVHPQSLYKVEIQASEFNFQGLHSSDAMTFKVKFTDFKKLPELMHEREWHVEDYVHQLIFPNMTIASAFGTTIAIQQIIPMDTETTLFISHVFAAKLSNNEQHFLVKAFNQNAVDFNRQVFEEDRLICEAVQEGLKQAHLQSGTLSKDEARVAAFEQNYMKLMEVSQK